MWTVGKPCSQLENYFSSHEATAAPVESAASLVRCSGMAGNTIDLIRQRLQAAATAGGSGRQEGGEFFGSLMQAGKHPPIPTFGNDLMFMALL